MPSRPTYGESIVDLLIATLASGRSVRAFHSILSERKFNRYRKDSVKVSLSRLHKQGYLKHLDLGWSLTKTGKRRAKENHLLSYIPSTFEKSCPDSMIVSFDIPEQSRVFRNWLRNQLKIFGYKMLQQSLWIGPSPLPLAFLKRLEDLGIRKNVKTFKIRKLS